MWRGEAVAPLSDHALSELHMPPQRQQARASDVEPRHDCRASLAAAPLSLPASLDSTQSDTDRAVAVLGEAMHRLNAGLFDSLCVFPSLPHGRAPALSLRSLSLCLSQSHSLLRKHTRTRALAHTQTHATELNLLGKELRTPSTSASTLSASPASSLAPQEDIGVTASLVVWPGSAVKTPKGSAAADLLDLTGSCLCERQRHK